MSTDAWLAPPIVILRPGITPGAGGGRLKDQPEDFVVDELPAYPPAGQGDFLFLRVEKRDVASHVLVRELSRRLGVSPRDVGLAGMKDRRAVTRQWVSVPARGAKALDALDGPVGDSGYLKLLEAERHPHKLKTGHLRGNSFQIRLRGRDPSGDDTLRARLEAIARGGFPNAFGEQRFSRGDTVAQGLQLLAGDTPKVSPRQRRLAVSALQSSFFNHWLADRAADGLLETALPGDVLAKRASGGVFICEDPPTDTARLAAAELVVTGPLPGSRPTRAQGASAERERALHARLGVPPEAFKVFGRLGRGTRRPALAWPEAPRVARDPDGLVVHFALAAGTYATVLLAHLCGDAMSSYDFHAAGGGR